MPLFGCRQQRTRPVGLMALKASIFTALPRWAGHWLWARAALDALPRAPHLADRRNSNMEAGIRIRKARSPGRQSLAAAAYSCRVRDSNYLRPAPDGRCSRGHTAASWKVRRYPLDSSVPPGARWGRAAVFGLITSTPWRLACLPPRPACEPASRPSQSWKLRSRKLVPEATASPLRSGGPLSVFSSLRVSLASLPPEDSTSGASARYLYTRLDDTMSIG